MCVDDVRSSHADDAESSDAVESMARPSCDADVTQAGLDADELVLALDLVWEEGEEPALESD